MKNEILHRNYIINFNRYKDAKSNNFQIEALIIIFGILEQVSSNIIIRLSSIDSKYHLFIKKELGIKCNKRKIISLRSKINTIEKILRNYKDDFLLVFKNKKYIDEIIESLKTLSKIHDIRNNFVHKIMLKEMNYCDLVDINTKCEDVYKVLNKTASKIKTYIRNNPATQDVAYLVEIIEDL